MPTPTPGPGEALVRVAACGLNRADTEFIKGVYGGAPRTDAALRRRLLPQIPGLEPVGTVIQLGDGTRNLAIGDRVLVHSHFSCGHCGFCRTGRDNMCAEMRVLGTQTPGLGGFVECIAVPAENLVALPATLSFTQAATVGVQVATAWWMIRYRANIRSREVVLIQGAAGGLGFATIQAVRACGGIPIAVTRREVKREALVASGAEHVLIPSAQTGIADQLRSLYPDGADVVIEAVGGDAWSQSLACVRQGGRIVVCGGHAGAIVPLHLGVIFGKQLDILGTARAPRWLLPECVELVANGTISIPIDKIFPFAEIVPALERLDRAEHIGKIVVAIGGECEVRLATDH